MVQALYFLNEHNVFNMALKEKSIGVRSGLLGGQSIGPALPIYRLSCCLELLLGRAHLRQI